MNKYPFLKNHSGKVNRLVNKYESLFLIGFRFVYGIRIVTPLILGGMSDIKASRFFVFNFIGSVLWASLIAVFGYFLGEAAQEIFGKIKHLEISIIILVIIAGIIFAIARFSFESFRRRRKKRMVGFIAE